MRGLAALFALLLGLQFAMAAQPTPDEQRSFRMLLRRADAVFLLETASAAADARKNCEAARAYAARFDVNQFWSGIVEYCFAQAAQYEKNKTAACTGYSRALALMAQAPRTAALDANLMGARTNEEFQKIIQNARNKLGC
jgi:hypothetical protein